MLNLMAANFGGLQYWYIAKSDINLPLNVQSAYLSPEFDFGGPELQGQHRGYA
jgi:hypothetical protein